MTIFHQHHGANQQFTITKADPPIPTAPSSTITGAEAAPTAKTVQAVLQNRTAAILIGAVYSKTSQMLDVTMMAIPATCGEATLRFKILPTGCTIKLTLLDEKTYRPLCGVYQFAS